MFRAAAEVRARGRRAQAPGDLLEGHVQGAAGRPRRPRAGRDPGQESAGGRPGSFPLPDGGVLRLSFKQSFFGGGGLLIEKDGEPLPGSAGDPLTAVKTAAYIIYFLAALNLVIGVVGMVVKSEFLESMGVGIFSVISAAVFAVLGFFTFRRSLVALIIAIVLYAADAIVSVGMAAAAGGKPGVGGIIMRIFFLAAMVKGAQAMLELKRKQKAAAGPNPLVRS
ncbi:MAG: hypothetical protein QM765_17250 [Myxococcales bacterium]